MALAFLDRAEVTAQLHGGAEAPPPPAQPIRWRYYKDPGPPLGAYRWAAGASVPSTWIRITKFEYAQLVALDVGQPPPEAPHQRDLRPRRPSPSPRRRDPAGVVPRDRRPGRSPRPPRPPRPARPPRAARAPRAPRPARSPRRSRPPRAPRPPRAARTPRPPRPQRTKPCPYRRTVCIFFVQEGGGLVLDQMGGQTIGCDGKPQIPPPPGAIVVPVDNPAACSNLTCGSTLSRWVQKAMQAIIKGWSVRAVAADELPAPTPAPGRRAPRVVVPFTGTTTGPEAPLAPRPGIAYARVTPFRGTAVQQYGTAVYIVPYPYDPGPLTGTNSPDWMLLGPWLPGMPFVNVLG